MAKFGEQVTSRLLSQEGLEVYVSVVRPRSATVKKKVWVRIQGKEGTQLRQYEALAYARSADVCFVEDDGLKPRKRRKSGPQG